MKKLLLFSIITYLLVTIKSTTDIQNLNENISEDEKILKVGVLLPLSGKFENIGQSLLKYNCFWNQLRFTDEYFKKIF